MFTICKLTDLNDTVTGSFLLALNTFDVLHCSLFGIINGHTFTDSLYCGKSIKFCGKYHSSACPISSAPFINHFSFILGFSIYFILRLALTE